jgi:hypothetical protein
LNKKCGSKVKNKVEKCKKEVFIIQTFILRTYNAKLYNTCDK